MGRSILAVLAGGVLGVVLTLVVEMVGHHVYPPPEGLDVHDTEALAAWIEQAPAGALVAVLVAWAAGALGGGWLATLLAPGGTRREALVVGILLLAMGVLNLVMLPHPTWFAVVGVLLFVPAALTGARLSGRLSRG